MLTDLITNSNELAGGRGKFDRSLAAEATLSVEIKSRPAVGPATADK